MITLFVREWLKMVAYCSDRDHFDEGIFMCYHDNYVKAWSELSVADQGEISYRLAIHKETYGSSYP